MGRTAYVFEGIVTLLKSNCFVQAPDHSYALSWKRGSNEGKTLKTEASANHELSFSTEPIKFTTNIDGGKDSFWKPKILTIYPLEVKSGKFKEIGKVEIDITKFLETGEDGSHSGNVRNYTQNFRLAGEPALVRIDAVLYVQGQPIPTPNFYTRDRSGSRTIQSHSPHMQPSTPPGAPPPVPASPSVSSHSPNAASDPEAVRLRRELDEVQTSLMLQLSEVQAQLEESRRFNQQQSTGLGHEDAARVAALVEELKSQKASLLAELEAKDTELRAMREELEATRMELAQLKTNMSPSPGNQKWSTDFGDPVGVPRDPTWDADFNNDLPASSPVFPTESTIPETMANTSPPPTFQDPNQQMPTSTIDASVLVAPETSDAGLFPAPTSMLTSLPASPPASPPSPPATAVSVNVDESRATAYAMPAHITPSAEVWTNSPLESDWLRSCSEANPVLCESDCVKLALCYSDYLTPLQFPDSFALGEVTLSATAVGDAPVTEIACRLVKADPLGCNDSQQDFEITDATNTLMQNMQSKNFDIVLEPGMVSETVFKVRLPQPSINRLRFDMKYKYKDELKTHSVILPVHLLRWAKPSPETAPAGEEDFRNLRAQLNHLTPCSIASDLARDPNLVATMLKEYLGFSVVTGARQPNNSVVLFAYTTFGPQRVALALAVNDTTHMIDVAMSADTHELAKAVRYQALSFLSPQVAA